MPRLHRILLVNKNPEFKLSTQKMSKCVALEEAVTVEAALSCIASKTYSLIIINLELTGDCCFGMINRVQSKINFFETKIFLTAKCYNEEFEIKCHDFGIDEIIQLPIKERLFRAFVEKYLMKIETNSKAIARKVGPLIIDPVKMQVKTVKNCIEEDLLLTLKEYKLLNLFLDRPGINITREAIFQEVWDSGEIKSRTIDMHVSVLRKKLGDFGDCISSIRGIGYVFVLKPEMKQN